MLYLLWTAINAAAVIYFLASCITAARAVWAKAGLLPLLVVVVGLVSFSSSSSESAARLPQPTGSPWQGAVAHKYIKLAGYYIAEIELSATYAPAADSTQIIATSTSFTGLKLGVAWLPLTTRTTMEAHQLHYYADGLLVWKLLGTSIYQERKQFTGTVQL